MAAFETTFFPAPGKVDLFPSKPNTSHQYGKSVTQSPITTGTSVIGIKFDGGVLLAADRLECHICRDWNNSRLSPWMRDISEYIQPSGLKTSLLQGSYGSLARFPNVSRTLKLNDSTALVASGDYADFQMLKDYMESLMVENDIQDDGHSYSPSALYSYLRMLMYHKRSKFDPFWNTLVIGGRHEGKSFLGYVDKLGVAYEENCIATGYGAYIAIPLIRKALEEKTVLTKVEAVKLAIDCLRVLYYRDARSINKFDITLITDDGVTTEEEMTAETNWEIAHMVKGYE